MATIVDAGEDAAAIGSLRNREVNGAAVLVPSQSAAAAEFWRAPARRRLRRGGATPESAWKLLWSKHARRCPLAQELTCRGTPLLWAVDLSHAFPTTRALLELADVHSRAGRGRHSARTKNRPQPASVIANWLEQRQMDFTAHGEHTWQFALSCLAAAHVVGACGEALPASVGWSAIDALWSAAHDAAHLPPDCEAEPMTALAQQLLAAELPLTLAALFPEMAPMSDLRRTGRQHLVDGIAEMLNGQGLPLAGLLPALRPLLACWTRCRALGEPKGKMGAEARREYQRLVRQAIRWSDAEGRPLFADAGTASWSTELLTSALAASGRETDVAAARIQFGKLGFAKRLPPSPRKPPAPADHSEWAALGLMRTDWTPRASIVAVDYSAAEMRIDVRAQGRRLFSGAWSAESSIAGRRLAPAGAWEQVCWFTDADVDYLEFRMALAGDCRVERQLLLARHDNILFLADHLKSGESATLEHAWRLPLADGLRFSAETETRDATVLAKKPIARMLPLALPEWRVDPRSGELTQTDGAIQLAEHGVGRALACPLFIDLDPRRVRRSCTWRQLTVAESLRIVSPDVAVGYRVQSGDDQWLFYRSQAERGNRTLLGQNTSHEFLAARFLAPSGAIHELVEVEG